MPRLTKFGNNRILTAPRVLGISNTIGGGVVFVHLIRDDFITADDAPMTSPRTCEPGPGIITSVQLDGEFSISGGNLVFPTQTTSNWGDLSFYGEPDGGGILTRTVGRAIMVQHQTSASGQHITGWWPTTTINTAPNNGIWTVVNSFRSRSGDSIVNTGIFADDTPFEFVNIMRSVGSFVIVRGDTYADWTLMNVQNDNGNDEYPGFANLTSVGTIDSFRVADLPANDYTIWNDDFGIVTQRLSGARAPGDTFTHEANFLAEFTVTTLPSSGQIEFWFRIQDASNYWSVTVNSAGDIDLDEVVAGVPTQRGTAAGFIVAPERVLIAAEGTTIDVFDRTTRRIQYTSASNFQTETNGELDTEGTGGAVDDIVIWPRILSGTAKAALDAMVAN